MDPAPHARASSPKIAARAARPRRTTAWLVLLAGSVALLALGGGAVALLRPQSKQAREAEGVRLAEHRAGEMAPGIRKPGAPPPSPESSLPASPTPLPMPGPAPSSPTTTGTRYVIRDPAPPHPAPGHLFVDTQPESTVLIDGEAKGQTPLDVLVGPGPKTLRLEAAGFRPIREAFDADQGVVIRRALIPLGPPP